MKQRRREGKKGAEIKKSRQLPKEEKFQGTAIANPISVGEGPLDKTSQIQNNLNQITDKGSLPPEHVRWVKDYDEAEDASVYLNNSKGH